MTEKSKQARFITFEGGEGAGKSTLILGIEAYLDEKKVPFVSTREPGGSALGEEVRRWLLTDRSSHSFSAKTELMLFLAARAQHLQEKVIPALERGFIVLCDRFSDSTVAYQGAARELGVEEVERLCHYVVGPYQPDLTIYLDIDPETGLKRAQQTSDVPDRIEAESIAFHTKVRDCFHFLHQKEPDRLKIIDATQSIDEVQGQARALFDEILP